MPRASLRPAAALILAGLISATFGSIHAQGPDPEPAKGRQFALLIGVEKYQKAMPLRYTINDVKTLATTLRDRGAFDDNDVLLMTDDAEFATRRPTRKNILEELPRWFSQMKPEDRLIVYFSGHGFQDLAGKLYLAPIDVDPAHPAETGVPVEWLRKSLAECKAKFKLLLIDACHAGTEKAADGAVSVPAKEVGDAFRNLPGLVTLASSTSEEKSQIWEDKHQSLFSYWLNQGLKGHADADGDGAVDIDELNKFVHRSVVRTARAHFSRPQTPVWIAEKAVEGSPLVIRVKPQTLTSLLADVAEQIALAVEDRKLKKVGVLQFSSDSGLVELLGAKSGSLGLYCAEEMEKRLLDNENRKFAVTNGRMLQASLSQQHFSLDDLAVPERLAELSRSMKGLPALAQGTIRARVGRIAVLRCRLIQTESDELAGSAGGIALLTPSEWAMLGLSAALTPGDQPQPARPDGNAPAKDPQDAVVARLDEKAKGPHPMADPKFAFPVHIYVGGKERMGHAVGNDWIVPLRKGEIFEIVAENRTGRPSCMRLLVDGLNTVPDLELTKGVATFVWGHHVNLNDARFYILDPSQNPGERKEWRVSGFITQTGDDGRFREFVVTTAGESLAAQRQFTEQLGLITAAFYDPAPAGRGAQDGGIGVAAGKERKEVIKEDPRFKPGALRAVVNIRYVEEKSDAQAP